MGRPAGTRYRAETATCASICERRSGLDGLMSGLNAQKARRRCAPATNLSPWQASHSAAPAAGGAGPPQVWQRMRSGGGVEPRGGVSGTGFSLNAASGARGGHARRCPWPRPDGESPGRQRGRDGGARASACDHVGVASLCWGAELRRCAVALRCGAASIRTVAWRLRWGAEEELVATSPRSRQDAASRPMGRAMASRSDVQHRVGAWTRRTESPAASADSRTSPH